MKRRGSVLRSGTGGHTCLGYLHQGGFLVARQPPWVALQVHGPKNLAFPIREIERRYRIMNGPRYMNILGG